MKEWKPDLDLDLTRLAKERGYTIVPTSAGTEDCWLEWREWVRNEEPSYFGTVFDPFVTFAHRPRPDIFNVGPGKGLPEVFFLRGYGDLLSIYKANTEQYVALAKRFAPRGFVEQEKRQELLIEHMSIKNQIEYFGQQHRKPMEGVKAVLKVMLKEADVIQGEQVHGILSTMPGELVDAHECIRHMIRLLWNDVIQGRHFVPCMVPVELLGCGPPYLARLWMAQMEGVFHYMENRDEINTKAAKVEPKWRAYEALVQAATLNERVPRWEEVSVIDEWSPTTFDTDEDPARPAGEAGKPGGASLLPKNEKHEARLKTLRRWVVKEERSFDSQAEMFRHLARDEGWAEIKGRSIQNALRQYLKRRGIEWPTKGRPWSATVVEEWTDFLNDYF